MGIMSTRPARVGAAAVIALSGLAVAPVVISTMSKNGINVPGGDTATRAATRLVAMLDARSPGDRGNGALTPTKVRPNKPITAIVPHERALGKIITPKPTTPTTDEFVQAITPNVSTAAFTPFGAEGGTGLIPPVLETSPGGADVLLPPIIGGPIFGGGPVPPGTPGIPPIEVPNVSPAVPEPATWMTMLLGFGMIGWTARRRRPVATQASSRT